MARGLYWTQDEDNILLQHYEFSTTAELERLLPGRGRIAIQNRAWKYLNLSRNRSIACSRYTVDRYFFGRLTEVSCYWAGFIAADGCVASEFSQAKYVKITLSRRDRRHLERFVKDVGYTGPIRDAVSRSKICGDHPNSCVHVGGVPQWIDDLKRHFNIIPRKSLTLQPPDNLERRNALAFLIGYIDGDGGIYHLLSRSKPNQPYFRLMMVGTHALLSWAKGILDALCAHVANRGGSRVYRVLNIFRLEYGGARATAILDALSLVDCPMRLRRKWDSFEDHRLLFEED